MKSLRIRLQEEANDKNIALNVIEKDYALSYVLAGIAGHPELSKTLIFKGGTALKKVFFENYRFSEDLDFSTLNAPKNKKLAETLRNAIDITYDLLSAYGSFQIEIKKNPERLPHPYGQEAFITLLKFPWQPMPLCRIKIEIAHDEPVVIPPLY